MQKDRCREIDAEVAGLLASWERLWDAPGLACDLTVEFSARLRASIGRCYPEQRVIRLASWVLEEDHSLVAEILCHEAAHLVVFDRHGRRVRPHGREWQALMRQAGFEPRVQMPVPKRVAAELERRRRRYRHECPVCGVARTAGRPMRRWRCAACLAAGREGRLVITRLDSGGGGGSAAQPAGAGRARGKRKQ